MHVHPDDPELVPLNPSESDKDLLLPLFVLHGVTTVRDMGGAVDVIKRWKTQIAERKLLGPRFYYGGPLVDGPQPMWPASVAVSSPEEGRNAVRDLKAQGVDFIKVYSLLRREDFFAVADECKKQGIPFSGHVPDQVTNAEGSDAGMASIEHMLAFYREFSDPAAVKKVRDGLDPNADRWERRAKILGGMLDAHDPAKEKALYEKFVKNGTYHCPTLAVVFNNAYYEDYLPEAKRSFRYLPKYLQGWWTPEQNVHLQQRNPVNVALDRRIGDRLLQYVAAMHKAGVKLMTGTDMGGNPLCFAGISMHQELELFVRAGLSPMDALICATKNPAEFMGAGKTLGTVEEGKIADLVLLDANPLASISNTKAIRAVIQGGTVLDRSDLDRSLAELAAKAAATRQSRAF